MVFKWPFPFKRFEYLAFLENKNITERSWVCKMFFMKYFRLLSNIGKHTDSSKFSYALYPWLSYLPEKSWHLWMVNSWCFPGCVNLAAGLAFCHLFNIKLLPLKNIPISKLKFFFSQRNQKVYEMESKIPPTVFFRGHTVHGSREN